MSKNYCSLGLMSGTSLDGIDASVIISNGENNLEIIDNLCREYSNSFKSRLQKFVDKVVNIKSLDENIDDFKEIEKEITLEHAKISEAIIKRNKHIEVNLVGFHGQTILHKPENGYSIQIGDPNLLSQLLKKKVYFKFRDKDIKNGGQGAPLTPIYHKLIYRKINLNNEIIFLNIGGIANLTFISEKDQLISFDSGPGNCMIDKWIRENGNKQFDKDGACALSGIVDKNILNSILDNETYSSNNLKSLDVKDFDITFAKGLTLENGAATITSITAHLISEKINSITNRDIPLESDCKIILCGGGRKNKYLIKIINELTNFKIIDIDDLGFDGNFIESQAFAYLAVRCYLKKNISFPSTTGAKIPSTGGKLYENF